MGRNGAALPPCRYIRSVSSGTQSSQSLVTRTVRIWLPVGILLMMFAALVLRASAPISNYDTYFNLRIGHDFLQGASLQHPGPMSQFATADWAPTQWGTQISMAALENWFGLPGVAWLAGALFLGWALALYLTARSATSALVAAVATCLCIASSTPHLSMRGHVVSFIFVVLTTFVWLRASETLRAPWPLVLLTWAWVPLHGMWPLGIAIGFAAVTGIALDNPGRYRIWVKMTAVPLLSAAVAALTPVGPRVYGAVIEVNSMARDRYTEWAPPDFTQLSPALTLVLLAACAVVMLRRGPANWTHIALLAMAAGLAIYSIRTVPVAASIVVPLLARTVGRWPAGSTSTTRGERYAVLGGFATAVAALTIVVPATADSPPIEPVQIEAALSSLPAGTPIWASEDWGGYVLWAHSNLVPVLHGYGDAFSNREYERYSDIATLEPHWFEDFQELGVNVALLRMSDRLGAVLVTDHGWRVAQQTDEVELLVSPSFRERVQIPDLG